MARQFCLAVLGLFLAAGLAAADEALAQAIALADKADAELTRDAKTGAIVGLLLNAAKVTNEDVAAIVDALKKAKPESVHVLDVFLGPAHTDAAVKKVAELETMRLLSMRRTKVTDQGLAALKPLTKLTTFVAPETAISDEGLRHLGEVKGLQHLILDDTQITDAGLKHLQKLRLVSVSVKRTKVTEAGAGSLKGVTVVR